MLHDFDESSENIILLRDLFDLNEMLIYAASF